ncbi:MAG: CotH kinase family protein, partial [Bacteroidota bacterium]
MYKPYADVPSTPDRIVCNAERALGDSFYNGDHKFGGADYQSSLKAHSGNNSIRLPGDKNTHYGFTTLLENPVPGTVYEASVWSLANTTGYAKIAIQGREPAGFYQESAEVVQRGEQGWNLHRIRFAIPFEKTPTVVSVYVYSAGLEEVFFDDLLIEKVDLWKESAIKPRQLKLSIPEKAMQQLSDKRYEALGKGLLITNDDDWVKAELETDKNQKLDVKLRLKGDWLDHLRGNKWSYRIKLKGSDAWDGMQTFSLHSPVARYHLHEWLLHKWWKTQDVLTPRYDFVELLVNGESRGIYAFEEHFQKQLVESQERREGPIVKFSEEGFWSGVAR